MELFTRLYIRLREAVSGAHRGQTYSEYALIFVCIVIALGGGYQLIGNNLTNSVSGIADRVGSAGDITKDGQFPPCQSQSRQVSEPKSANVLAAGVIRRFQSSRPFRRP